jgi:N-acetylglucosamine kinase-like BadF-type ATPase
MAYFLAMDAGGTKTDYVLADETRELARARGGTIKLLRTTPDQAAANLDKALATLVELSGVSLQSVARTCIGTAGESVPMVVDWLTEALHARVAGELTLVGDVEIALDAAFHGGPGVLALAGTGSNVAGRLLNGELTTAGGWGPALADQGSGYQIGRRALRAAFLARDEERPSLLIDAVLGFWNLSSVEHLIEYANRNPAPDFSSLTEVVVRCASLGDPVAARVLEREGEELAFLVSLVIRRMRRSAASPDIPGEAESLPALAFAGSILQNVPPVRDTLVLAVRREFPSIKTLDGVIDPIAGALWRARTTL